MLQDLDVALSQKDFLEASGCLERMTDPTITQKGKKKIERALRQMCDEITKKVAYITTKSTTEDYFEYNQILQKVDEAIRKFEIDKEEIAA